MQCRGNQGNHGIIPWYSQNMTVASLTFYNPAGEHVDLHAPGTSAIERMPLMPQYSCTKGLMPLGFVQPHLCGELNYMFGKA